MIFGWIAGYLILLLFVYQLCGGGGGRCEETRHRGGLVQTISGENCFCRGEIFSGEEGESEVEVTVGSVVVVVVNVTVGCVDGVDVTEGDVVVVVGDDAVSRGHDMSVRDERTSAMS